MKKLTIIAFILAFAFNAFSQQTTIQVKKVNTAYAYTADMGDSDADTVKFVFDGDFDASKNLTVQAYSSSADTVETAVVLSRSEVNALASRDAYLTLDTLTTSAPSVIKDTTNFNNTFLYGIINNTDSATVKLILKLKDVQ